jgi:hypothetical protein
MIHKFYPLKLKLPAKTHVKWTAVSPLLLLAFAMCNLELISKNTVNEGRCNCKFLKF